MATRKAKAPKAAPADNGTALMLDALKFVSTAQTATGPTDTRHCVLFNGWAFATNRTLTMGHPIGDVPMQLAPLTSKLVAALERCGDAVSLTELPSGLSVRSGSFRAVIPCCPLDAMPYLQADPNVAPVDDAALRAALAAVAPLAVEGSPRVITAAVCLRDGSAIATNGAMLIERWHGVNLPTMLVPKASVATLLGIKRKIVGFGYSGNSATFHFEDTSWIKTQLYQDGFPDFAKFFEKPRNPWPVPVGFFDAVRNVSPFVNDDEPAVYFMGNVMRTSMTADVGGSYEIQGLPDGRCFNPSFLLFMDGLAQKLDWGQPYTNDTLYFEGEFVRGVIMPRHWEAPKLKEPAKPIDPRSAAFNDMDDDIPF